MQYTRERHGLTIVECLVVTSVAAAGVCCAAVLAGAGPGRSGRPDAAAEDAIQVRQIVQSLTIFASGNDDSYPLPSDFDLFDTTVASPGREKDTSANIFSFMVYIGALRAVECISPLEVNKSIEVDHDYALENPPTAVDPANALWDPGFSVDFTGEGTGNLSYAHLQPAGDRLRSWMNSFSPLEPVISNRGPETVSTDQDARRDRDRITIANQGSNTHKFLPPRNAWVGHVGYNDGRVEQESSQMPDVGVGTGAWPTYLRDDGVRRLDALFLDESDDPIDINTLLGVFTEAGAEPEDFEGIWD